ncbi:MAG: hypothetical protein KDA58_17450, partial [Planctomycetaceae bacterium]|nr:hypothetical protein [Planctomycetaceae bacterium]
LGLLGLLSQPLFMGGFTLLITVEATLSWRSRRRRDAESRTRVLFSRSRVAMICLAACLPFVACMLLGAMLPSTDFDVKEYHLQGPKEYFLAGRIHFLPHNVYTSFPFLTEMLSLAGMVVYGDWYFGALVGKTVLMVFAPITALAVYAIARRLTDQPSSGWFAALAYLSTPWAYRISIIAYTEGAMCCYVALALLAWLIFQDR